MSRIGSLRKRAVGAGMAAVPAVRMLGGREGIERKWRVVDDASRRAGGRLSLARDVASSLPALAKVLAAVARDERVPLRYRIALIGLVPYLLSPVDPIPDFLPVVGALDDAALVALVLRWVFANVDHAVLAEHWEGSPDVLPLLERIAGRDLPGARARS